MPCQKDSNTEGQCDQEHGLACRQIREFRCGCQTGLLVTVSVLPNPPGSRLWDTIQPRPTEPLAGQPALRHSCSHTTGSQFLSLPSGSCKSNKTRRHLRTETHFPSSLLTQINCFVFYEAITYIIYFSQLKLLTTQISCLMNI